MVQVNGAPFFDNLRFGVYNPQGIQVQSNTVDRYAELARRHRQAIGEGG